MNKAKQSNKTGKKIWIQLTVLLLLSIFSVFTVACTYVMFSDNEMLEWISQGSFEEESDHGHNESKTNKEDKEPFQKTFFPVSTGWKSNLNGLNCLGYHSSYSYKSPIRDILTPPPEFAC